ncbi:hypothetical protein AVEN_184089-1 [Araneus ventricosus]|uniref:Uncharacterized protein n=1 Tax=Araneus ventricosus TaxID=182803 RepID=A0A4Y2CY32_ARAVE|nr:hypothetical protein AVEN_184089-1 [Araneus ventricosus]
MWRLLGSHMHDRYHAVMRLPVHLPNQKRVTFKDGHEEEALEAARSRQPVLESWFQLNQSDPGAASFKFLRTVDNVIYDAFKQAAFHRHFLNSDEECDRCLHLSNAKATTPDLRLYSVLL